MIKIVPDSLEGKKLPVPEKTGWNLPGKLSKKKWVAAGQLLARARDEFGQAYQWWLGDWWNACKWGDGQRACDEIGVEYQTAHACGKVCKSIEFSRRRLNLSFSIHREVSVIKDKKLQEEAFNIVEQQGLSVRATRELVQKLLKKPTFNETNDSIEWARWSWNPITGCLHGCEYCYARDMARRFKDEYPKGFKPHFRKSRLTAPMNTKLPNRLQGVPGSRNVFVCSMSDIMGEWVPAEWVQAVIEQVEKAKQWNFLFLTKNPKRYSEFFWPDNAWLGATVDIQERVEPTERAFADIASGGYRFISCEPLEEKLTFNDLSIFDWVIIGGRSRTSRMQAMTPDRDKVLSLVCQAYNAGCKIYRKPNLGTILKEWPGDETR